MGVGRPLRAGRRNLCACWVLPSLLQRCAIGSPCQGPPGSLSTGTTAKLIRTLLSERLRRAAHPLLSDRPPRHAFRHRERVCRDRSSCETSRDAAQGQPDHHLTGPNWADCNWCCRQVPQGCHFGGQGIFKDRSHTESGLTLSVGDHPIKDFKFFLTILVLGCSGPRTLSQIASARS